MLCIKTNLIVEFVFLVFQLHFMILRSTQVELRNKKSKIKRNLILDCTIMKSRELVDILEVLNVSKLTFLGLSIS